MKLDRVALLARLELNEEEKELFSSQVGNIIEYVDKLNELDIDGVEPTAHVLPIKNVFREDELRPSLPREKVLRNAPRQSDGFYRVPKIIE